MASRNASDEALEQGDSGRPGPKRKPVPRLAPYGPNAVEAKDLTFSYGEFPTSIQASGSASRPVLRKVSLELPSGSRCLVVGANGSGKSTLLRVLAGRHLVRQGSGEVRVLGLHAFHDTRLNFHRAHLDCDWGMRTVPFAGCGVPLAADMPVRSMMARLQESYPDRRDDLVRLLGIDLDWRMHQLSDGQRRRVQILLGLIRPFKLLLLDEITTSLDVCVRQDLLRWLVRESSLHGATVLYATHIFDGLDDWPTHLLYLTADGSTGWQGRAHDLDVYRDLKSAAHPAVMLAVAEHWLRAELDRNRALHKTEPAQGEMARYSPDPTDRHGGYSSGRSVQLQRTAVSAASATAMDVDKDKDKDKDKDNDNHSATDNAGPCRLGRLCDFMGNAGVLAKHK